MCRFVAFLPLIPMIAAVSNCATAQKSTELPMRLTVDQTEIGDVMTGAQVRDTLSKCSPPSSCRYVGLEREPQINYAAEYDQGGYTIAYRSGPPGPLWEAERVGAGPGRRFSVAEMITITADYLEGRQTQFVRWVPKDLASE